MTKTLPHPVVSHETWLAERSALLSSEKELTRLQDELAARRRALPWVKVDKDYVFDTPAGKRRLPDLFGPHRQLLVQHFMMGPGWEQGCPSCSFMADHLGPMLPHLAARDIAVAVVARAPVDEMARFMERMGWRFSWASAHGSDFNFDFGVSFRADQRVDGEVLYNYQRQPFPSDEGPGISVFHKDDAGQIFHTYSTYGRGLEAMMGTYDLIDLTPRGRDEGELSYPQAWIRHHDRYEQPRAGGCCHG